MKNRSRKEKRKRRKGKIFERSNGKDWIKARRRERRNSSGGIVG